MLKLNMGAGRNKIDGFDSVDKDPTSNPDWLEDLEKFPWPWDDNSVDEMLFNHSLEHMGRDPDVFLGIFKEIYRVCCPGALVYINVPHPRHDFYLGDPTHVRPITRGTLELFNQDLNRQALAAPAANSPLGIVTGTNFVVVNEELVLDPRFAYLKGDHSWERVALTLNNVISEAKYTLRVVK